MSQKEKRAPKIIAIGGGKGGVGKSLISSGIATSLAQMEKSTICIDLDLGGANIHTFFGLKTTKIGLGDFIYRPHSKELSDYTTECNVPNLKLVSGAGFIPGIANLYYFQKVKILRAIQRLDFEYVILDLGAGTNYNVIDFFSLTRSGIVVTNPEPTAILNAYEFIKNVLFRIFTRSFKQGHIAHEIIEAYKFGQTQNQECTVKGLVEELKEANREAAERVIQICKEFRPYLVLNMVRSLEHSKTLAANLIGICKKFLDIELGYLGAIPIDKTVTQELVRLNNLLVSNPDSKVSKAINKIARGCLEGFTTVELPMQEEKKDGHDSLKPVASEGSELSKIFSNFLNELASSEGILQGKSSEDTKLLDILEPQLRLDQSALIPIFLNDNSLVPQNIAVPKDFKMLLPFIVKLGDLEKESGNGKKSDFAIDNKELGSAWFQTGQVLQRAGQFSTAARSFRKSTKHLASNPIPLIHLANCLMLIGRLDESEKYLTEAQRDSEHDELNYNLAILCFLKGDYERSLSSLKKIKTDFKEYKKAKKLTGYNYYYMEKYRDSLSYLKEFHQPEDEFNKGLIRLILRDFKDAIKEFRKILEQDRTDSMAWALLSLSYFEQGLTDDAILTLEKAIAIEPANIKYRAIMAHIAYKNGLMDKAISNAQVISKLRPKNPNLLKIVHQINNRLF